MKVLIREEIAPAGVALLRERFDVDEDGDSDLAQIIGGYDAIVIRSATKLTADLIERGDKLKVIGRAGVGVDNVDVDAATRRGVVVANAPDSTVLSAAEQTIGLVVAVGLLATCGRAAVAPVQPIAFDHALHAGRDEREVLEVAIRDRQRGDLFGQDVRRRVGLVDVDDRRFRADGDRLARRGLHRHAELRLLADTQHEFLRGDRREAFERERDFVLARRKRRKARRARRVGHGNARVAGFGTRHGDGHAGKRSLRLVESDRFDRGLVDLSERGCGGEDEEQDGEQTTSHSCLRLPADRSVCCDRAGV